MNESADDDDEAQGQEVTPPPPAPATDADKLKAIKLAVHRHSRALRTAIMFLEEGKVFPAVKAMGRGLDMLIKELERQR